MLIYDKNLYKFNNVAAVMELLCLLECLIVSMVTLQYSSQLLKKKKYFVCFLLYSQFINPVGPINYSKYPKEKQKKKEEEKKRNHPGNGYAENLCLTISLSLIVVSLLTQGILPWYIFYGRVVLT